MDKFRITGGRRLEGRVQISGAKNSALPCMAAALLTSESVTLHNLPYARDIITMRRLLEDLGCHVLMPELRTLKISADDVEFFEAPYELVKTMRASVLALGPLLARFGEARVSMPGGCAIGQRPIDLHLAGFEKLGASVTLEGGDVIARAARLQGHEVYFDTVTVTGTETLMMAAALADGVTVLNNAAREPEIVDLAELLNKMGARVDGAGTDVIHIEGADELEPFDHAIISDRIEAGTYMVAAAMIDGGDVVLEGAELRDLEALAIKLRA
ncbi:MAG TPA: UDP-N-acetylglucosamine 1-carboxyvinyltransferase, partial [Blastocatellia bacterium]|nr:UDP-N-acetylglucosamine 1-carboxyvinyltransferase [Blastocatellia bacterium]